MRLAATLLASLFLLAPYGCGKVEQRTAKDLVQYDTCYRVIDGDTFVITRGQEHIRPIGIDAPERGRPHAAEATAQLGRYIKGRSLRLERDVRERDRFERLLRYVWADVDGDGREDLVNELMVEDGLAAAKAYPPDVKYRSRFEAAQARAQAKGIGIWNQESEE